MKNVTREEKVDEFRRAAGKGTYKENSETELILDCIHEEFMEFYDAVEDFEINPSTASRAQLCKEWADLQYVVSQAAVYFDIPADVAFNRVHNSNMTKVIEGKVIFREDGKILKPDTYRAPDMRGL
jgi:Uncharacterized protein conserved in bacteria